LWLLDALRERALHAGQPRRACAALVYWLREYEAARRGVIDGFDVREVEFTDLVEPWRRVAGAVTRVEALVCQPVAACLSNPRFERGANAIPYIRVGQLPI
jgi:hypothetical protein